MQNNKLKIILSLFFFVFITFSEVFGQAFQRDVQVADSLFEEKKFTESFEIYKAIYEIGEHASPAMLLKMAYIREGLGDESGALYYLNTYYLQTNNERVFVKMEDLADQNDLEGYEHSEQDWFYNIYHKYYYHLLIVLLVMTLILFAVVLYKKMKHEKNAYYTWFGGLTTTILLLLITNFGNEYKQGILVKKDAYIMSAPSASADVLDISKAGHRIQILGQEDVWLQIQWGDQIGYVKNTYVRELFF